MPIMSIAVKNAPAPCDAESTAMPRDVAAMEKYSVILRLTSTNDRMTLDASEAEDATTIPAIARYVGRRRTPIAKTSAYIVIRGQMADDSIFMESISWSSLLMNGLRIPAEVSLALLLSPTFAPLGKSSTMASESENDIGA